MMDTILPFMEDKATTDPEKAFRLIDHVEFPDWPWVGLTFFLLLKPSQECRLIFLVVC